MALRFNPPPNWPSPPEGFEPPPGWQPDPAWGPAPEGWQLWVDDSAPATGLPDSGSAAVPGADPAWAPTGSASSAPTGPAAPSAETASLPAHVADPTGSSASAPSGDYVSSTSTVGGPAGYDPGADYSQAPTPFHNQQSPVPPGTPPGPVGNWQPVDVAGGLSAAPASRPVTRQWWFWTIIAAVLVVALVLTLVLVSRGSSDDRDGGATAQSSSDTGSSSDDADSSDDSSGSGSGGEGTSADTAIDPTQQDVVLPSTRQEDEGKDIQITVHFDPVTWDANDTLKADNEYIYEEPPEGQVYITVPVTVTYQGEGQFNYHDLDITYEDGGNTSEPEIFIDDKSFYSQSMPRNGGSATGYYAFLISEDSVNSGNFVISAFDTYSSDREEWFVQAK